MDFIKKLTADAQEQLHNKGSEVNLLDTKELNELAKAALTLSKRNKVEPRKAVDVLIDSMVNKKYHPAVTPDTKKFVIKQVRDLVYKMQQLKEEFDMGLTKKQMKEIRSHALKFVRKNHGSKLVDAIIDQLENIPGLEHMNLEKLAQDIINVKGS